MCSCYELHLSKMGKFSLPSQYSSLGIVAITLLLINQIHCSDKYRDLEPSGSKVKKGPIVEDDILSGSQLETKDFYEASKRLSVSARKNLLDGSRRLQNFCGKDSVEEPPPCPREFKGKCSCYCDTVHASQRPYLSNFETRRRIYTVECVNAGFTDTYMLQFLPPGIEKLVFTGNNLKTLTPNLFGNDIDYPDLKWIDLSDNNIEAIPGKTFHRVGAVEILYLSNNEISNKTIHDHSRIFSNFKHLKALHLTNAFNDETWSLSDLAEIFAESNLSMLTKLHLEQNEMQIISDPNVFCELTALKELYLADNQLEDLNINVTCLPYLDYIDLFRNHIRSVKTTSGIYSILNHQNFRDEQLRINLAENPFFCDCNLQPYIDWLKLNTRKDVDRIPYHDKLHCYDGVPESNKGLPVVEVPRTECEVLHMLSTSSVATTLVWILSLVIVALTIALLYCHRKTVAFSVSPLLNPSHGVKYTSIEKNEEQGEIAHV